jgi:thiosulfate dehydrogenase
MPNVRLLARRRALGVVAAALTLAACSETRDAAPVPTDEPTTPLDAQAAYLAARKAEVAAMPDPPAGVPQSTGTRQEMAYMIQLGEKLLRETNTHPLTAPYMPESGLTCSSCHRDAGRKKAIASTFIGAAASFPAFNDRDGGVVTLQDRVNSCFMRSMNGVRLPENSEALLAIVSYISWLSRDFPVNPNPDRAVSTLNLSFPNPSIRAKVNAGAAVASAGAATYVSRCQSCHGEDGDGSGSAPPVWGGRSYNKGAGLANNIQGGSWIQFNMPPGEEFTLTDQEAVDVAAFINSQPRPAFVKAEHLPNAGVNYGGPEIVLHYGLSLTPEQIATRVPTSGADTPDGAALYGATCSGCHGPLATSTKKGRTAAQISAAIASVPTMSSLSMLTSAEIEAVADALQ